MIERGYDLLQRQMVTYFKLLRPMEAIFRHWKMENRLLDWPDGWFHAW